LVKIQKVGL